MALLPRRTTVDLEGGGFFDEPLVGGGKDGRKGVLFFGAKRSNNYSSSLKNDDWKTNYFHFGSLFTFSGAMLVKLQGV